MPNETFVTDNQCKERRNECGSLNIFKNDIKDELHSIDKRLFRIELAVVFASGAYIFFTEVLPRLQRFGQTPAQ